MGGHEELCLRESPDKPLADQLLPLRVQMGVHFIYCHDAGEIYCAVGAKARGERLPEVWDISRSSSNVMLRIERYPSLISSIATRAPWPSPWSPAWRSLLQYELRTATARTIDEVDYGIFGQARLFIPSRARVCSSLNQRKDSPDATCSPRADKWARVVDG